jgi:hypothetical protein
MKEKLEFLNRKIIEYEEEIDFLYAEFEDEEKMPIEIQAKIDMLRCNLSIYQEEYMNLINI